MPRDIGGPYIPDEITPHLQDNVGAGGSIGDTHPPLTKDTAFAVVAAEMKQRGMSDARKIYNERITRGVVYILAYVNDRIPQVDARGELRYAYAGSVSLSLYAQAEHMEEVAYESPTQKKADVRLDPKFQAEILFMLPTLPGDVDTINGPKWDEDAMFGLQAIHKETDPLYHQLAPERAEKTLEFDKGGVDLTIVEPAKERYVKIRIQDQEFVAVHPVSFLAHKIEWIIQGQVKTVRFEDTIAQKALVADRMIEIWEKVFPHDDIIMEAARVLGKTGMANYTCLMQYFEEHKDKYQKLYMLAQEVQAVLPPRSA